MSPELLLLLALAGVAGLPILLVLVRNPVAACALLIVAVPMTGGLGTSLIPGFRISEVLTLLVLIATLLNRVLDRDHRPINGLDIPIGGFAMGIVLIPTILLLTSNESGDLAVWRRILGPLQYLITYAIFSRSSTTEAQQRLLLNLVLGTSVVVSVIGVVQLADLPGVRDFLLQYYPRSGPNPSICEFGACRPTSVLSHWSSFGAYALLHYTLALALSATPGVGISNRWLGIALAANAVGVLASETQATILGMGVATVIVVLHRRRIPIVLVYATLAGIVGLAALWTEIGGRLDAQLDSPDSFLVRERYWGELFVPLAMEHPWFGTATVIPSEVPTRLVNAVDNEYLGMMFRAGAVGVALMVGAVLSIAVVGFRVRTHAKPLVQALGGALAADFLVLALMGLTAEYITFGGVTQALWMTVGIFAQASLRRPAAASEGRPVRVQRPPVIAPGAAGP